MDAFIDESSRETPDGFCYVIAAAVTVDDADLVRDAMLKLRAPNQLALHWHSEKAARRREIVHRVAELDVQAFGVCCHPVSAKRQERARARLLVKLIEDLDHEGVDHMIIEARQENNNRRDRSTLLGAQSTGVAPNMAYSHVGKLAEPLLWVADVIAGVLSLHFTGVDSSYFAALETSLLHVRQIDPEP